MPEVVLDTVGTTKPVKHSSWSQVAQSSRVITKWLAKVIFAKGVAEP